MYNIHIYIFTPQAHTNDFQRPSKPIMYSNLSSELSQSDWRQCFGLERMENVLNNSESNKTAFNIFPSLI